MKGKAANERLIWNAPDGGESLPRSRPVYGRRHHSTFFSFAKNGPFRPVELFELGRTPESRAHCLRPLEMNCFPTTGAQQLHSRS